MKQPPFFPPSSPSVVVAVALLAVLKDYRKDTIKQFFRSIPPEMKEKIIEVCGDMKWMYVKLTDKELPQAKMVVDKFHLIRDANVKIDEARRIEQEATNNFTPSFITLFVIEPSCPLKRFTFLVR